MAVGPTTVSVVIPTRNRSAVLGACLRGVMRQEDVQLDVIVVNDGSTDGTAALLRAIDDPRLRVIQHDGARGVAAARNVGIEAARGDWVAFTDDDDLWAPSKTRKQVAAAEACGAGFAYCGALVFFDDSTALVHDRPVPSPEEMRRAVNEWNPLPGGASAQIVRTGVLRTVGGFDETLSLLADWDMWIRLAAVSVMAAVDEPLVAYRRHTTNMVRGAYKAQLREFDDLVTKHKLATLDGVTFHAWLADGQMISGRPLDAARIHLHATIKYRSRRHLKAIPRALACAARKVSAMLTRRPRGSTPEVVSDHIAVPSWLEELRQT